MEDNNENNNIDQETLNDTDSTPNVDNNSGVKPLARAIVKLAFAALVLFLLYSTMNPQKFHATEDRSMHSCFAFQRLISNAVENHNMESSDLLTEVNEKSMQVLTSEGRLSKHMQFPTSKCKYESYETDNDICVYCVYHGEANNKCLIKGQTSPYLAEKKANSNQKQITAIGISALILAFVIWAFK